MLLFLTSLFSLISNGFAIVSKHPIVLKMMFFTIFSGLIAFALKFFFDMVKPYIVTSPILSVAYQLGLIQALALYITIVVAGFGVKQILAFLRS